MLRAATSTVAKRLTPTTVGVGSAGCVMMYTMASPPSVAHSSSSSSHQKDVNTNDSSSASASPTATAATNTNYNTADAILASFQENVAHAKPILEASTRAMRLVHTVVMIVCEYKMEQCREYLLASLERLGMDNFNLIASAADDRAAILVEEVRRCTRQLEEAQECHTNIDDNDEGYEQRRKDVMDAAERLGQAEKALMELQDVMNKNYGDGYVDDDDDNQKGWEKDVHARAAKRLHDLCRTNGGTYIKVGQHLANLDHLLPPAYIKILYSLFGDAPVTPYEEVREVIREELGDYPENLFEEFDTEPIASASLAQVHVAKEKGKGGKKLAIKVQHRGLRETSRGDLIALETVVRLVDSIFDEFKWGWVVDEIAPNLPKELDFCHEGRNADFAASHMKQAGLDCIIPKVHWDQTTERVLVMDFEAGHSATNIAEIEKSGIRKRDLALLISSVFQSQIFQTGFVHCDPHPENVYWRLSDKGKPQVVLFDHGLYKQLDDNFRVTYAKLWKSLLIADVQGIKESCSSLGVDEMYPLLSAMLTSRPFDEVIERTKTKSFTCKDSMDSTSDAAMIRGYAQRYLKEIIQMLDRVPRQMLLLFKMNDCLRHIDHSLGSPANTLVVAGKYAASTVYDNLIPQLTLFGRIREWMSYFMIMSRIKTYEFIADRSWLLLKNQ